MSVIEFMQTSGVSFLHSLPRFGHSSDFSQLFSTTQSDQLDYIMGLWAVCFFILAFFIMWACIIITLGCMGKQRVGLLAGRVRVMSDDNGDFYTPRHLWKLRVFYVMLGVAMILCNVAIIGPGLHSVEDATFSTRKLTRDVDDLATQGLLIMDGVSSAERNIEKLNVESLLNLEYACPNLSGNMFLNDKKVKSAIASLDTAFNNLEEFVDGSEFEDMRDNIDMIMDGTSNVDEFVTQVEMNDWIVKLSVLFLNALVGFMIITTLVSLSGTYLEPLKFVTMVLVFPAFIVIVSASWIGAAFISFIGISNADFCSGPEKNGPDQTVNSILQSFVHVESIVFKAFIYFQSNCSTQDPIEGFYKYDDFIQTGINSAQTFLAHVNEVGIDQISDQCGASVRPFVEGIGLVKDNLGILLSALRSTFDLASCSRMRPIYEQAFQGTACTDTAGSLTLMSSLLLTVGFLGMLMIMFRAAMYPCKLTFSSKACSLPDEEQDEWEEYQAYLQYMSDFLSYWGRNNDEETPSIQKDNDFGTKSFSSLEEEEEEKKIEQGIPGVVTCNEADSLPPSRNPDYDSTCPNPIEVQPLSPSAPHATESFTRCAPSHINTKYIDTTNEECQPLSPDTPTMQSIGSVGSRSSKATRLSGRLRTPDFLSPGTFRRWRRNDIEESSAHDSSDIPKTPLLVSPKDHSGSYFSRAINMTNFISPLAKRAPSPTEGSPMNHAKDKYF